MMRRHHTENDLRIFQCLIELVGASHVLRDDVAIEKKPVHSALRDALADFFLKDPKSYLVRTAASEHDRERRAPGSSADDRNFAHAILAPNLLSVPAMSRRMFW